MKGTISQEAAPICSRLSLWTGLGMPSTKDAGGFLLAAGGLGLPSDDAVENQRDRNNGDGGDHEKIRNAHAISVSQVEMPERNRREMRRRVYSVEGDQ